MLLPEAETLPGPGHSYKTEEANGKSGRRSQIHICLMVYRAGRELTLSLLTWGLAQILSPVWEIGQNSAEPPVPPAQDLHPQTSTLQ